MIIESIQFLYYKLKLIHFLKKIADLGIFELVSIYTDIDFSNINFRKIIECFTNIFVIQNGSG